MGVDLIVKAIKVVRRDHPRLQINVQVENSETLAHQLLEGLIDFAICRIPQDINASLLMYQELGDRQLSFICRPDHPLLSRPALELDDLVDAEWLLQPPGMLARRSVEALFRSKGLPGPHRVINSSSFLLSLLMLRETDALSVVAHPIADHFASLGSIGILLPGQPFSIEPIVIVRARNRPIPPGAAALLEVITMVSEPPSSAPPSSLLPKRSASFTSAGA